MVANKQKLYELLFLTATEGLVIADHRGEIEMINPKAAELFGYSEDEMIGMNVDSLLPGHMKEKHVQHRASFMKNPRKRPMGLGHDLIGVRKDGSSFPLEISLNHMSEGGQIKVMALIMDVTIRKEQEAEIKLLNKNLEKRVNQRTKELNESQRLYRLISRNFPNGTINVFDQDLKYVFAEGAEIYKYGITSDKLVGKSYLDRVPKALQDMMKERLEKVLQGESQKFEIEYLDNHYLINTTGLENHENVIDRILLVEQNITERKKAEVQMEEAFRKERQLNELKSRFVSMASHEFRTPLSTVLSSLSLLEKYDQAGVMDKKEKHYKRIRSSVRQLTNILNDFLSLEKVETGKAVVNHELIDLKEFFEEIVDRHNQLTKQDQLILFEFEGPAEMIIDPSILQIICSNLLSNAIKYSADGKQIELKAVSSNTAVRIEVKDQGIGIPYDEQENMFSRFFRAKNAVNIEGTGLGLNIIKRYVDLLEGQITFESVPDEGSTFKVVLPNSIER